MTPAVKAAKRAGIRFEVLLYEHDPKAPSYGLEAAESLGQEPARVFKTLLAKLDERQLCVACVPVALRLDLKSLASAAKAKRAAMAEPAEAQRATGYVLGGISPLGQRKALPTFIDESANGFDRIFVSGGRRGMEIALAPADLVRLCRATLAPLVRGELE